ncbi:MAG TPA: CusA/CzcA family heavy metal efflux RND transporter [Puia sp.]|jgi:cobalt-zinc-cadmium resistance protein CzcA|nr:CusA/CzcA family heavy metal efflux RND transporter [Puia sp.]
MNKTLKNILAFSLKNKYFIYFSTIILVVYGVITFMNMPIEAFPDVTNTEITVITQWPGRSAEEVEKFVTIPIEIALNPVNRKTSLRSTSIFGLSVVKLIFEDDVQDTYARTQVNTLLQNVTLPDNINPQVQPPTGPTGEIFRYSLVSSFREPRELKTLQDWTVDRELRSVPGIADIVSFGGTVKAYEIQVNPQKLTGLGITPLDVYTAVNRSNINIGGDVINKNNQAYIVRGIGLLNDINEIKNIFITNINGLPVLVKNVADVQVSGLPRLGEVGRSDAIDSSKTRTVLNDNDVVEAIVLMRKGENPDKVIKALKLKIQKLNDRVLPPDVKIVPFYNREELIHYATHTVMHNLIEGILLVTLIVSLFMFNWRTTLIVSIIIPLSLLFAFICLHSMGMSANLLSLGAIDFGIIIDGAVVMVEGLFVMLDQQAKIYGMEKFNKLAKMGMIKKKGSELAKSIFFSKIIIITALLPIFSFQKVEGKMFSPLAYTLGFALLGALIFTLTLVPVLVNALLNKNVREKHNPFTHLLTGWVLFGFKFVFGNKKLALGISIVFVVIGFYSFKFLGSEFLPELNEGSLWVRATMPYSIALDKSVQVANQMRSIMMQFPQVKKVVSQTGRPDDGTDVAGFYNNEFDVALYPQEDWNPKISKDELIEQLRKSLSVIPGAELNFSQPIMDNVEEAVSGVKGSICVKIFGDSLNYMEQKSDEVDNVLKTVKGITDLGVIRNIGQPELDIDLDQDRMALYGVSTADANAVIEMAIGGKAVTQLYESGVRHFDIRIRFPVEFRSSDDDIGNLQVPTASGSKVPVKQIATITQKTGPCLIFRDDNERYSAIKFSIEGRDMGSAIKEAQEKVDEKIKLKKGYNMVWQGDFENQQRASKRLAEVVPISLLLIFLLLFIMFGNLKDAGLVFLNVPFAVVGGIFALMISGTNFSISAGIGFIALFGICILEGVLLTTAFKQNLERLRGENPLYTAVKRGVNSLIRPVLMTAFMATIGLLPAAMSAGIGSESSRPLARVVIGGLICATIFSLLIFPVVFFLSYRNVDTRHQGESDDSIKAKV